MSDNSETDTPKDPEAPFEQYEPTVKDLKRIKKLEKKVKDLKEKVVGLTKRNKDLDTVASVFIAVAFVLLISAFTGWSHAFDVQAKYDKYRSQYSSNIQYRYLPSETKTVTVTAYPTPATPTVTPTTTTSSSSSSPTATRVTPTTPVPSYTTTPTASSVKGGAYSGFPDSVVQYGTTYYYYGIASSRCAYYRGMYGDTVTWCYQS